MATAARRLLMSMNFTIYQFLILLCRRLAWKPVISITPMQFLQMNMKGLKKRPVFRLWFQILEHG